MKKRLFITQIKVKRLPGARMPSSLQGAVLHCYIPAATCKNALESLMSYLHQDRYELVEVRWFFPRSHWPRAMTGLASTEMAAMCHAQSTGDFTYGAFHTWPKKQNKTKNANQGLVPTAASLGSLGVAGKKAAAAQA